MIGLGVLGSSTGNWNFRSLELLFPGTFAPESENDVELSLPETFDKNVRKL